MKAVKPALLTTVALVVELRRDAGQVEAPNYSNSTSYPRSNNINLFVAVPQLPLTSLSPNTRLRLPPTSTYSCRSPLSENSRPAACLMPLSFSRTDSQLGLGLRA
ncbi:Uncharacterized protein HZ326_22080 [Fusarium oxysporum f. sp. albedinis]|nr:Uncharacterized protein HZ326_22080 [Fusarium oxysporum f. sp. albedinis]